MNPFRPCILIPTFDNPATVGAVVRRALTHCADVVLVNDGSGSQAKTMIDALERDGLARVVHRARNGGKGRAVKDGLAAAREFGFSHALQVDADGQHDLDDIPRFLAASRASPDSLVLGQPVFDDSVPAARLYGRRISVFWAAVETFGNRVGDPLCGFRVYPIDQALRARARGNRMDFDPEVAVRMVWNGVPVQKLATKVRYITRQDGGVSHFQGFRDNVRISLMHTRLVTLCLLRAPFAYSKLARTEAARARALADQSPRDDRDER
jgi:glycosyltransferase involved in cell wall biosynthesis